MRYRHLLSLFAAVMIALSSAASWATPPQAQDTARRLYDRVMEEFKRRDYEAAMAGFRFFLELHGRSSLAPNAQYWIGECAYRMGRYKEAMTAFTAVVTNYPTSQKLAASTLKIGQSYDKLGDHEQSRLMYERVLTQYPGTPESEQAHKAIDTTTVADHGLAFSQ